MREMMWLRGGYPLPRFVPSRLIITQVAIAEPDKFYARLEQRFSRAPTHAKCGGAERDSSKAPTQSADPDRVHATGRKGDGANH